MAVAQIEYFHNELSDWKKSFQFFKDEISIFNKRLAEVLHRNSKAGTLAQVEQFQNQFILQNEQFDILRHEVHVLEAGAEKNLLLQGKPFSEQALKDQHLLRERIFQAERIFLETKHEFYRFLSKVF